MHGFGAAEVGPADSLNVIARVTRFDGATQANARLIAAAPALLEAAKAAEFMLAALCVLRDSETRTALRAAITQATGA